MVAKRAKDDKVEERVETPEPEDVKVVEKPQSGKRPGRPRKPAA